MTLTDHEQKILELVQKHPEILTDTKAREHCAKTIGLSEKTLRNRIGELKRLNMIPGSNNTKEEPRISAGNELTFIDYSRLFWQSRKWIFNNVFAMTILIAAASYIMPKTYKSSAVLMPPKMESGMGILGSFSNLPMSNLFTKTDDESLSFIAILKSRTVLENVIEKFNLIEFYESDNIEKAIIELSDNVIFEIEDEGTIRVSVLTKTEWFHPDKEEEFVKQLSADMTNYFIENLDYVNKNLKTEKASFQRMFIEERYKLNIEELKKAEENLKLFQIQHGLIELSEQTKYAIDAAASIKGGILANEVRLGVMNTMLSTDHPDIEALEKETEELQKQLKEMDYGPDIKAPDQAVQLFPIFAEVPELGIQLLRLQREVEIQNTLFTFLTQQYEEAKIKEARDTPTIQILDEAKTPINRFKPRRTLLVISTFLVMIFINFIFLVVKINYRDIIS